METIPEDKKDQGEEEVPEPMKVFLKSVIILLVAGLIAGVIAYLLFFSGWWHVGSLTFKNYGLA
ncbi:hypothetical protein [Bdellovibrio sp. BCCA]|uniref:hypothetical protein n=1 Tax=Bdellovibrio sp. BCCA TaxID=3136281 RepID=UPI0030F143D0